MEIQKTLNSQSSHEKEEWNWKNLPKETKDLCIENYKTLVKEIKEDANRWTNAP